MEIHGGLNPERGPCSVHVRQKLDPAGPEVWEAGGGVDGEGVGGVAGALVGIRAVEAAEPIETEAEVK